MEDGVRVVVLGTGQMGCAIGRLLLERPGAVLAGAYARRAARAGVDLGDALGLPALLGIPILHDLDVLVERARPHVAIQATCSRVADAIDEVSRLVDAGVHVISIAEEMAFPACRSPGLARELDARAIARDVTVLGTGINPGFVLDLLVVALTGVCRSVRRITARRVNDLSPYGPSVLASQGVGLTPEAFEAGVRDGSVVGHVGFPESAALIGAALGWEVERVVERREPIVAKVERRTPFVAVAPGRVAGCLHSAVAYVGGEPVIELVHPQQVHPEAEGIATGDGIEIEGDPTVCVSGSPEIPGGVGTAALAVNMIPHVMNAPPGLKTMLELPVPAACMSDLRGFLR